MIVSIVILPLALLTLMPAMATRRRDGCGGSLRHLESMTANLAADSEEYLAWLADRHWPDDEYLDLEFGWRSELGLPGAYNDNPVCPGCRRPGDDVWPCHECGAIMHSRCGHGMRRKKIAKPYRTRDMGAESVIAEWLCVHCTSIVGLDVDRGDEKGRAP